MAGASSGETLASRETRNTPGAASPRISVDQRPADPLDLTFPGRQPTNQGTCPPHVVDIRVLRGRKTVSSDEKQFVHTLSSPLADALTVDNLSHSSSCRHCVVMETARSVRRDLKFVDATSICTGRQQERR
jgi:hypothetical protein